MSYKAIFRFYEELNNYLPAEKRKSTFSFSFEKVATINEAICSLGVPTEEVDLVLVNGESVTFDHIITNGDRISVYPIFESLDISGITKLRDKPLIKLVKDLNKLQKKGDDNGQEKD
jgi:sulfur carrier protein ThiS